MYNKNYILTYKKHRFSPLQPEREDIDIEDIAHSLSLMCRANGHFSSFFSVAEHSINCAKEAEERGLSAKLCMVALLHDSSEAYLADITRPVKIFLPDYRKIEKHLQQFIYNRFNAVYTKEEFAVVNEIDNAMLFAEFVYFAGERLYDEEPVLARKPDFTKRDFLLAEKEFLELFGRFEREI
jgi:5'-deoxynucleotidase YfbR-like HD superfamily hydrolase